MSDEWRVEVDLDDEQHGFTLGERLRSLDLDDEARERLGDRVVVTRDGAKMFLYAATEEQAREAERVARDLIAAEGPVEEAEMQRTFNMGIGMIAVVAPDEAGATLALLEREGHRAFEIGRTVPGAGVTISPSGERKD